MVRAGGELQPFLWPELCASTVPMKQQLPKTLLQKRRGPQPKTGKGVTIGTRLQQPFLDALDRYIAERGGSMTRAGAIRDILAERFKLPPGGL